MQHLWWGQNWNVKIITPHITFQLAQWILFSNIFYIFTFFFFLLSNWKVMLCLFNKRLHVLYHWNIPIHDNDYRFLVLMTLFFSLSFLIVCFAYLSAMIVFEHKVSLVENVVGRDKIKIIHLVCKFCSYFLSKFHSTPVVRHSSWIFFSIIAARVLCFFLSQFSKPTSKNITHFV